MITFAELHDGIFHAGKNFTGKIFADAETKMALITKTIGALEVPFMRLTYRGKATDINLQSVKHITDQDGMIERPTNVFHAQDANKIKTAQVQTPMDVAQVSTPHDHVFAGPDKAAPTTRRRIAKVQGE